MNLRINVFGFTIASVTLEFPESVTVTPGYPPVVKTMSPLRQTLRKGIKGMSTLWVGEMSA